MKMGCSLTYFSFLQESESQSETGLRYHKHLSSGALAIKKRERGKAALMVVTAFILVTGLVTIWWLL